MKSKFYSCILLWIALLCPVLCFSQRSITVAPGAASALKSVPYNGHLYFLNGDLFHFDGTATIAHPLPSAGGSPLVATSTEPPSAVNSKLYVSCSNASGNYVYSYDGTAFANVPL